MDSPAPEPARLSRVGAGWRLGATALALGILVVGQVADTNDLFPLGSLSQYATARDLNGTIGSVYLAADFGDGQVKHIPLNEQVVGVGRAEIEGQLGRFKENPNLLGDLARSYAELNPGKPEPQTLYLRRSVTQLKDGKAVGEPTVTTLAEWSAS